MSLKILKIYFNFFYLPNTNGVPNPALFSVTTASTGARSLFKSYLLSTPIQFCPYF